MRKSHIFILIVIALAIGIIITSAGDASQYVTYQQAQALAQKGEDSKVHVVGELTRNEQGEIIGIEYDPLKDPNFLAFNLIDENKQVFRVVCYNPPPSMQDFKKSEKIVIIGKCKGQDFVASEILMKCPSKYEETKIKS
jgi:cytochrome c-type biogenesis protein CcmE